MSDRIMTVSDQRDFTLPLVIAGGLLAGLLDLLFAIVFYGQQGVATAALLQGIASGAVGPRAEQMGASASVLGACLHFLISIAAAFVYYAVSRKVQLLVRRPYLSGTIFGIGMYLFMRGVVLPLSHIGFHVPKLGNIIGELLSHVFLFGWVIALAVAYARRRSA